MLGQAGLVVVARGGLVHWLSAVIITGTRVFAAFGQRWTTAAA